MSVPDGAAPVTPEQAALIARRLDLSDGQCREVIGYLAAHPHPVVASALAGGIAAALVPPAEAPEAGGDS